MPGWSGDGARPGVPRDLSSPTPPCSAACPTRAAHGSPAIYHHSLPRRKRNSDSSWFAAARDAVCLRLLPAAPPIFPPPPFPPGCHHVGPCAWHRCQVTANFPAGRDPQKQAKSQGPFYVCRWRIPDSQGYPGMGISRRAAEAIGSDPLHRHGRASGSSTQPRGDTAMAGHRSVMTAWQGRLGVPRTSGHWPG